MATRRRWPPDSSEGFRVVVLTEPDETQDLRHSALHVIVGQVRLLRQTVADVLRHRQRIEEGDLLEHHADVPPQSEEIVLGHAIDPLAVHENRAGVRSKQPEDEFQQDRFPGAACAEQNGHAPRRDTEAHIAQDNVLVEGKGHLVEHDRRHGRLGRYRCATWRGAHVHEQSSKCKVQSAHFREPRANPTTKDQRPETGRASREKASHLGVIKFKSWL